MAKRHKKSLADEPLTSDDTYERGATCGCAGEPMHAIAEPATTEAHDSSNDLACLPWVEITKDPDRFNRCRDAMQRLGTVGDPKKLYAILTKFKPRITSPDQEVFWCVAFDTHGYVRGVGEITRGARDRVQVPIPDVLRMPLLVGAQAFAIAHLHPSGNAQPSAPDKALTKDIERAGNVVGMPLLDHLVIGVNEFYSFADKKMYRV